MRILITLATFALTLFAATLSNTDHADAQDKTPIRIGAVLSVTGVASTLGDPQLKTLNLYVEQLNRAGGIDGRAIELFAYDDESNSNKADRLAKKLIISDKVVAIIGGSTTGATLVMAPLAEESKILLLSLAGGSAIVRTPRKFIFVMGTSDTSNVTRVYKYLQAHDLKKIGIIGGADGYGLSALAQAKNLAEKYDIQILGVESYNPKDTDVTAQLTNLRNLPGIQAILDLGFGQPAVITSKNYKQLSIKLPHIGTQAMASDAVIKAAGDAAEGMIITATPGFFIVLPDGDPRKALVEDFLSKYKAKYNQSPNAPAGYAVDALLLIKGAVESTHSSDPVVLQEAIEKVNGLTGVAGTFRFSAESHVGLDSSALGMLRVKAGGTWELVE